MTLAINGHALDNTDTSLSATDSSGTQADTAASQTGFIVADQTTGTTQNVAGTPYTGALLFSNQYIVQSDNAAITADNLNITALTPNTFIHSGSGEDAIDVSGVGGNNVLDGSTGSNFLKGGAAGTGTDTFFVDNRSPPSDIWSTIANFHMGDVAAVFGITAGTAITHVDNQGAAGYTGLTFHAVTAGAPEASFTLAGYTTADLTNGRLSVSFNTESDGTTYMAVQGTG